MTVELRRTVRLCIDDAPAGKPSAWAARQPRDNTYAAWPTMEGFGRYYEFDVCCRGDVDERTGYFLNIKEIDDALRSIAIDRLAAAGSETPVLPLCTEIHRALAPALRGTLSSLRLRLTPCLSVTTESKAMNHSLIQQNFEFAASHRLHCDSLSNEENKRLFGKCNNPNGHGHNYRIEVSVAVETGPESPPQRSSSALFPVIDRVVNETVIQRFDHMYLNIDCPEFRALNPSVENIARVCYELLSPAFSDIALDLRRVRVWETEKTSCTYPAPDDAA